MIAAYICITIWGLHVEAPPYSIFFSKNLLVWDNSQIFHFSKSWIVVSFQFPPFCKYIIPLRFYFDLRKAHAWSTKCQSNRRHMVYVIVLIFLRWQLAEPCHPDKLERVLPGFAICIVVSRSTYSTKMATEHRLGGSPSLFLFSVNEQRSL